MRPPRLFSCGITLLLLTSVLCGCTSSTTIKPYAPALQGALDSVDEDSDFPGSGATEGSLAGKSVEELIDTGFAYLRADNPDLARLHFVAALRRNADLAWPYVGIGNIEFHAGNYSAAMAHYQKAASIDSQNLSAILGQAQCLRLQGNPDAAGEKLSQAMLIAPNDVRVLTELAINYESRGQGNLATPLFQEIVTDTPNQPAAHNNLGVNYLFKGELKEAIASLTKAQRIDPSNAQITNNLATALALAGEEQQALALFRKTVGEPAAWNNLGYLYMTQGKLDAAERALRKAVELAPQYYQKAHENLDRLKEMKPSPVATSAK